MPFLGFVLVAVMYAAAMVWLGRFLRSRGYGSKLNSLAARYERAQDNRREAARSHLSKLPRLTRRAQQSLEDESSK